MKILIIPNLILPAVDADQLRTIRAAAGADSEVMVAADRAARRCRSSSPKSV